MESADLRKLAAELRRVAAKSADDRHKTASSILDAAVALRMLQQKVRYNG